MLNCGIQNLHIKIWRIVKAPDIKFGLSEKHIKFEKNFVCFWESPNFNYLGWFLWNVARISPFLDTASRYATPYFFRKSISEPNLSTLSISVPLATYRKMYKDQASFNDFWFKSGLLRKCLAWTRIWTLWGQPDPIQPVFRRWGPNPTRWNPKTGSKFGFNPKNS